jgi:transposase
MRWQRFFEVSPSSVINWLRRSRDDGSSAATLRSALS